MSIGRMILIFVPSALLGIVLGVSGAQAMLGEPVTVVRWLRRPRVGRLRVNWCPVAYYGWGLGALYPSGMILRLGRLTLSWEAN